MTILSRFLKWRKDMGELNLCDNGTVVIINPCRVSCMELYTDIKLDFFKLHFISLYTKYPTFSETMRNMLASLLSKVIRLIMYVNIEVSS